MKRQTPQPKWWQLFLLMPAYILLAWIINRLALSGTLLEIVQIGTVLLIFFLANRWIGENEPAFTLARNEEKGRDSSKEKKDSPVLARLRLAGRSLTASLIVLAATLLMAVIGRSVLGEGVIALLYLGPIGWTTVRWGRIAGASAALTAALCFDFFFIPPFYTFRIGSLEGWLLLALFMLMSLVVVGRVMALFSEARRRELENNFLVELVALMADLHTREDIAEFVLNQLQGHYQAGFARVILYQRGSQPSVLLVRSPKHTQPAKELPERSLPVYSGVELIGKITIGQASVPLPGDDDPLLQSICHLMSLAVDRAQAAPAGNALTGQQQSHAV